MSKGKLKKFSEVASFPNVYQNYNFQDPKLTDYMGETVDLKGKWNSSHFKNDLPITLELACGRGEYTVNLAQKFPDRNFIGVDIKGARIHQGAKIAMNENLGNVAFLRARIEQLDLFVGKNEIDEIWITFPDPFLRPSKARKRLTSPRFIEQYRHVLKHQGHIHLKTDSEPLYDYTLEIIEELNLPKLENYADIYGLEKLPIPELEIKTYYERMHLENQLTIKYIKFGL